MRCLFQYEDVAHRETNLKYLSFKNIILMFYNDSDSIFVRSQRPGHPSRPTVRLNLKKSCKTVRPTYQSCGLSVSWTLEQVPSSQAIPHSRYYQLSFSFATAMKLPHCSDTGCINIPLLSFFPPVIVQALWISNTWGYLRFVTELDANAI